MTPAVVGGLLGLALAVGVLLVAAGLPVLRRPDLDARLAPYLYDAPRPSRFLVDAGAGGSSVGQVLRPALQRGGRALQRMLGGSESLAGRLRRSGSDATVEDFRMQQVVWASAALLASVAATTMLISAGRLRSPVSALALCLAGAVAGMVLRDLKLSRDIRAREQRILAELPTISELLALAVAAGESAGAALERVVRLCRGELSSELGRGLGAARSGTPLVTALHEVSARVGIAAVSRFLDGMVVAIERGTPLAEVLRAQAVDVRDAGKRALLESGGRKEIGMMIPVVFVVLPVTVVFALFPGFYGLTFFS